MKNMNKKEIRKSKREYKSEEHTPNREQNIKHIRNYILFTSGNNFRRYGMGFVIRDSLQEDVKKTVKIRKIMPQKNEF